MVFTYDEGARRRQVAVESLSVRHHAAEGLLRLLHALAVMKPKGDDAPSIWLAVADTPNSLADTVNGVVNAMNADKNLLQSLYFRPDIPLGEPEAKAFETALARINHANLLLTNAELPVNTANNKVKHGLAVSARDDLRVELITTAPDENGNIPVSAFDKGKSMPIFDRPLLSLLGRPPGREKGVELTTVRIDVPSVLSEAWMFASVYSTIFHVRALKHFGSDELIAPYPALPVGPAPAQILTGRVEGLRTVVTTPADGSEGRQPGLFLYNTFIPMHIDYETGVSGGVVAG
ncbi:hypothetical protein G3T36_19465 [Diaminobutyricibacter tongyongensis]|uniref:Uncharacterized protein n=1 Tax=Leifsonia tongyongensis TaxID=1268043 RepID=A0A6L9Y2Y6_9MICO|nr:hypothetical protein [Diaminobutyricibacter tongyongensis]NEN08041.1 hypothetical protein [Diaminobutyricibacter tongyongensis]